MVAYTDITERTAQEERLHALIDASPVAIVEFDLDANVRLWSPAAERIFGWSRAEILGQHLPMVPESKLAESDELRARVHAGETYTDYETVRQRKDGTLVDVSIAAAPVHDGYGRVVSNIAVYADITERKAHQAELHRLVEDLAASRVRIVTAGDVERRRLERNLHDGAQQRLVTLALSLRLAQSNVDSDPAAVRARRARENLRVAAPRSDHPAAAPGALHRVLPVVEQRRLAGWAGDTGSAVAEAPDPPSR